MTTVGVWDERAHSSAVDPRGWSRGVLWAWPEQGAGEREEGGTEREDRNGLMCLGMLAHQKSASMRCTKDEGRGGKGDRQHMALEEPNSEVWKFSHRLAAGGGDDK